MEKTIIYTKFVNDKGVNDLVIIFDNYGVMGKSHKDRRAAYKNYLRNGTRANKKAFLKDIS